MYEERTGRRTNKGVTLEDLTILENIFELNIQVYELVMQDEPDDDEPPHQLQTFAKLIRRSHCRYAETMYINLYGRHFCYISNLKKYSRAYPCSKCGVVFNTSFAQRRHQQTCDVNVQHKFPGGIFHIPPTIFDKLHEDGVTVADDLKFYPFRATFDYECYFEQVEGPDRGRDNKLTWEQRHELLSVSVASNVPDFQAPKCFVTEGNPGQLVSQMVTYLHDISRAAETLVSESFRDVFVEIDGLIELQKQEIGQERDADEVEGTSEEEDDTDLKKCKKLPAELLKKELEEYLRELPVPVLGFNSGRYDLNVIKKHLYTELEAAGDNFKHIVKKAGSYMSMSTGMLKFLDISNYLAPGYSYDTFFKAYECNETKGFFPYEWMTNIEKLNHPELPPHEAFYSNLKGVNITEAEYEFCTLIWRGKNMTSFRDFLIWYNNLDVVPFINATEKMFAFYRERNIDMFKTSISVPGLSMQYLFQTLPEEFAFSLIDEKNKDLYYLIKHNIVGGPSIIFHRHHEKDKTYIRGGQKLCRKVVGFDANALYLWSLTQDMPTGTFIRRKQETNFKLTRSHKHGEMARE